MAHQPAPDYGAGAADSTHAVDVYPVVAGDGLVDVIEDGHHILWFFRNASVVDGKSGPADVDAHVASFQLRGVSVGNQLSGVGQVDEVVDSSVQQVPQFCGCFALMSAAGVLTGGQPSWDDPIAVGYGAVIALVCGHILPSLSLSVCRFVRCLYLVQVHRHVVGEPAVSNPRLVLEVRLFQ